ncbi:MAG: LLM class flavin-dependent oxidoreductase, partial [Ilumatobacter sp.]|nr:LLM class flavin-dependent oxidoreductase [Ilumatobacter sp.]
YRPPAMLAHLIASLADISGGRYVPTLGAGNSFDYDQLGVDAERRGSGLEECVQVVAELLRTGTAHLEGSHWTTDRAELAFRPDPAPPIVVAASGPRAMAVTARLGDGWNGWIPTDPESSHLGDLLERLDAACADHGRDPATLTRTVDVVIDPLDLAGARTRSIEVLAMVAEQGIDEVRCWLHADATASQRAEALDAYLD